MPVGVGGQSSGALATDLLPQPGGFEGLGVRLVHRCLRHLAVAQFPDERDVGHSVDLEAARPTYRTHGVPYHGSPPGAATKSTGRSWNVLNSFAMVHM